MSQIQFEKLARPLSLSVALAAVLHSFFVGSFLEEMAFPSSFSSSASSVRLRKWQPFTSSSTSSLASSIVVLCSSARVPSFLPPFLYEFRSSRLSFRASRPPHSLSSGSVSVRRLPVLSTSQILQAHPVHRYDRTNIRQCVAITVQR